MGLGRGARGAVFAIALAARSASAAEVLPGSPPPGGAFGWQIAAVDLGVVALAVGGGALTSRSAGFAVLPVLAGIGYYAGGPLVHAAHGDGGGAWTSLGVRALAPVALGALAGGAAALATRDGPSDICSSRRACAALFGGALGVGTGVIGAMVFDWATAREPVPPRAAAGELRCVPLVAAGRDGVSAGLALRW